MPTTKINEESSNHRTRVGKQRREKTESQIIRAALRVFAEKGRDGAVIDDILVAANISRGTFYNYFESVEKLLDRTSGWLVEDLIKNFIEPLISVGTAPDVRLATGIRLFLRKAELDRDWAWFIARIWNIGPLEAPARDIRRGIKEKLFLVPSYEVARDMMRGTIREALLRIATDTVSRKYPDQITQSILQGLGVPTARIDELISQPLPEFEHPK